MRKVFVVTSIMWVFTISRAEESHRSSLDEVAICERLGSVKKSTPGAPQLGAIQSANNIPEFGCIFNLPIRVDGTTTYYESADRSKTVFAEVGTGESVINVDGLDRKLRIIKEIPRANSNDSSRIYLSDSIYYVRIDYDPPGVDDSGKEMKFSAGATFRIARGNEIGIARVSIDECESD